jgi:methionyl-tRNA synthetase
MITSQLGNLLARIMSKKLIKNMKGNISENTQPEFDQQLSQVRDEVGRRMEEFHVTKACEEIMDVLMQVRRPPDTVFLILGVSTGPELIPYSGK